MRERTCAVSQGGRESSCIKGTLHDRKVLRRERAGKRNQDIIGKCEEHLREEQMYRTGKTCKRGKETFHNRKRKHATGTERGSDRCSIKKGTM